MQDQSGGRLWNQSTSLRAVTVNGTTLAPWSPQNEPHVSTINNNDNDKRSYLCSTTADRISTVGPSF